MSDVEGLECWTCTIPGQPVAKGRPRFARRGKGVIAFTPKATASWEMDAAIVMGRAWGDRPTLDQPCELTVAAIFPRPQRLICTHKRACECSPARVAHDRKPDLDNVVKAVCDALQRSVIRDDSSVCSLHAVKVYSRSEEPACVQVRLCWGDAVEAMR